MAKPKNTPPSRKGGKYSFGSIALTLILVLLYWWSNGAQPEGSTATPATSTAAVATTRTLPTTAAAATATEVEAIATTEPTVDTPTDVPTEPPAATAVAAIPTATVTPLPTATKAAPPTVTRAPKPTTTPTQAVRAGPPGMPTITLDELPPEALDTIDLIDAGGPFPFDRDGVTFQNRERLLPAKPRDYYREYTVITPGEDDRGARRIIAGEDGELYYTEDHYDSFYWILRP